MTGDSYNMLCCASTLPTVQCSVTSPGKSCSGLGGWKAGRTLDWSLVHHRTNMERSNRRKKKHTYGQFKHASPWIQAQLILIGQRNQSGSRNMNHLPYKLTRMQQRHKMTRKHTNQMNTKPKKKTQTQTKNNILECHIDSRDKTLLEWFPTNRFQATQNDLKPFPKQVDHKKNVTRTFCSSYRNSEGSFLWNRKALTSVFLLPNLDSVQWRPKWVTIM